VTLEIIRSAAAEYVPQLISAVLILVLGYVLVRLLMRGLRSGMERARVDPTLARFASNLGYMILMTLLVISALGQLGVNTTSFAAILAAAGVAIGFALQGSLSNFAAGVMLILFRPFKVDDFVEAAGVAGTVEEIQVFATQLKTPDNKRIVLPNASITNGCITNFSANPTRRIDLVFGIGYGDDLDRAKQVILDTLAADERILEEPAPFVGVCELGASSVDIAVRPWVAGKDFWATRCELLERIKRGFDANGISIPYPQRDVHVHPMRPDTTRPPS